MPVIENSSLLFSLCHLELVILENTLTNNKQKIDYFQKEQVLDDNRDFACYFQNS